MAWRAAPGAIDEAAFALADPFVSVLHIATAKVRAVTEPNADEVVLGADTLVVADGAVLGKPPDADAARGMLRRLRGKAHLVFTGLTLQTTDARQWGAVVSTRVTMRDYADSAIDDYIARGEPFDKAGAYAIQDAVFAPVDRVDGCYLNVVGLPLCAAIAGLAALRVAVETAEPGELTPPCGYCRAGASIVSG